MKNLARNMIILLMLTIGGTLFTSCDSDRWDEETLTGIWWSVDDDYDVICLNLSRGHTGTCTEYFYDRWGILYDTVFDTFDWDVNHRVITLFFHRDGRRWYWDYDLYNGHTVEINGRLFSRDRYYSKKFQKGVEGDSTSLPATPEALAVPEPKEE